MSFRRPARWAAGLTLAAMFVGAGGALLSLRPWFRARTLLQSTAGAVQRPIEGRLCGMAFAPRPTRHGDDEPAVRYAAVKVLSATRERPHTEAVALLLFGKTAEAASGLRNLTDAEPANADYWNDLAAARLEEGAAEGDVLANMLALAAADRALTLEPNHAEARFNRAVALDALALRFASIDAWRRYLEVDTSSSWAREARTRLAAAEQPTRDDAWKSTIATMERAMDDGDRATVERIVREFPQQARAWGEGVYLPQWGEALLKGDVARARLTLARAQQIGAALRHINGEGLLDASVSRIELNASAAAAVAYRQARLLYSKRAIAESLPFFADAQRRFAAAHNPMELLVACYRAYVLIDLGDRNGANAIADDVERRVAPSYRAVRGHVAWIRERLAADAGHYYEALVAAREALAIFGELGDLDHTTRLRVSEASILTLLGRDREAWQARGAALAGAAASGKWSLVESAIEEIARDATSGASDDAVRSLLAVQIAAPSTLPAKRFDSILWLSSIDARAHHASPDMSAARAAAARIPDVTQRADAMDELHLASATSLLDRDPAKAERALTEVLEYRTSRNLVAALPSIYVWRARARRLERKTAEAESDLRRAIDLIEARGGRIAEDRLRDAFLGESGDAYDELAQLLLERGAWREAFEVSERARSGNRTATLDELTNLTPAGVVVAHYTTTASRTLLVIIEHGRVTHAILAAGRAEIENARDTLVSALQNEARTSQQLDQLLIEPLRDRLDPSRVLIIVPDESTYGIPFAALRDPDGRFLIERTAIVVAPTARAVTSDFASVAADAAKTTVVADPAFDPSLFPQLDRLPSARRDAQLIAKIFPHTTALAGEAATRAAVAQHAANSDILHVASHALVSRRDAWLSLIALARSNGDDGVLYLTDVEQLELERKPLVVLAGCQTGSLGGGKGSIKTLAHAFLAAGSRAVLSSLWSVDDEHTSTLTASFYRRLARGATIPSALREAQLEAMRVQPPRQWAAFQLQAGVPRIHSPREKGERE